MLHSLITLHTQLCTYTIPCSMIGQLVMHMDVRIHVCVNCPCSGASHHLRVGDVLNQCDMDSSLSSKICLQVQVVLDTATGSLQVLSGNNIHLAASISKLSKTASVAISVQVPQPPQQASSAQKLLSQFLASPEEHDSDKAVMGIVHPSLHAVSEAQVAITGTDASLQLASIRYRIAAGIATRWTAVQVLPASSGMQQHAAATLYQTVASQRRLVSSIAMSGHEVSFCMQGIEARSLQSGSLAATACTPEATESVHASAQDQVLSLPLGTNDAEEVLSNVQAQIMITVIKLLHADIGHDEPLMAAGLDSLGATELVQSLQSAFDISLPATMVFDYPTVAAMAAFITQQVLSGVQETADARAVALPSMACIPEHGSTSHMALIAGVAGGEKLLQQWTYGDAITTVPHSRWDVSSQTKAGSSTETLAPQFGSFLTNVDQFDSAMFGVMASEALTMDPQQRLLLQSALEAFPGGQSSVRGRAVGAYVGIGTSDYNTLIQQANVPFNAFSFTAGSASVASGRLAFAFGLQGPTASIDTACSASLVAAHMACQSFRCVTASASLSPGPLLSYLTATAGCLCLP